MDEKSLPGLLANLVSGVAADQPGAAGEEEVGPNQNLVETLKAVAELAGGPVQASVDEFLGGEGELAETTRAAAARGKPAVDEVAAILMKQFNLSAPVARLIAGLMLKLAPGLGKTVKKEAPAKKKPRKTKPKTSASAKKKPASSAKKPKKKTAAKPKTSTSKPAAKKKSTSKTAKKSAKSTAKKKKSTRSAAIDEA